jgi:CYTH domain-containing protein
MRYEIPFGKHLYEVDVFEGDNKGLIIAEIELEDENESFEKPNWLGQEVTGDDRYYNASLSVSSYKNWQ